MIDDIIGHLIPLLNQWFPHILKLCPNLKSQCDFSMTLIYIYLTMKWKSSCTHVFVCAKPPIWEWTEMYVFGGLRSSSVLVFRHCPTRSVFETGLLKGLRFTNLPRLLGQWTPGIPLSVVPGSQKHRLPHPAFLLWILGIELMTSSLPDKYLS